MIQNMKKSSFNQQRSSNTKIQCTNIQMQYNQSGGLKMLHLEHVVKMESKLFNFYRARLVMPNKMRTYHLD
jgi:hypothetical protein